MSEKTNGGAPGLGATLTPGERQVLLGRILAERAGDDGGVIPRRADGGPAPLSWAQQQMWLLHQMDPGSAAYTMPYAVRLRGALDVEALGAALTSLAARHETLRTRIPAGAAGEPVQVVDAPAPVPLPLVDLRAHADPDAEARRLARAEAARPFDLAAGPLLRASVLQTGDESWTLLLTLHHIVSDGWSMGVLVREVGALYAEHATGERAALPPLPLQYADYAVWQRARLQGPAFERQVRYWIRQLEGAPPLLEVPTDRPRGASPSDEGRIRALALEPRLALAAAALAAGERATLHHVLLAAWAALLSRWSGQDEVVVGTPSGGRDRVELEGLIGFFVNMLPVRAGLGGDPSFRALVGRVREAMLAAHAHRDVPFARIVAELAPERSASHAPVFQAAFAFHPAGAPETATLRGAGLDAVEVDDDTTKFDLYLTLAAGGDGALHATLQYRAALFDDATAGRMLEHFATLLDAALDDPERPLSALSLLAPGERARSLAASAGEAAAYPRDATIHALFADVAAAAPDAVALVSGGERTTYGELDARANRLAHRLRALGVGPDTPVAIAAERSPATLAGVLGILKAGGAYLPLDPANPSARLAALMEDAGARVLLAHPAAAGRIPAPARGELLLDDAHAFAPGRDDAVESGAGPEHLAYVVYTSGSTGTPKGVAVPHRAVVRLVRGSGFARLDDGEALLHYAPLAFDASTFEIWGALLNGGRVVVAPPHPLSPAELEEVIAGGEVTTAWLTAGLFHQVAEERPAAFAPLRQLVVGGDVLSPTHLRRVREMHPRLRLVNGYGPTENTTFTCCREITSADLERPSVPLGTPVANTAAYVLDGAGEPAPDGVWGELYAGGDGVARGYHARPAPTAERFVPDPFSGISGARLYRTGDRVRRLPDGALEFGGRLDAQVKLRGFRVEPGEVEAALRLHPAVREAAVVVQGEGAARRLVAYATGGASPAELRAHLRERLPEYLVPAVVVALDALPLTPSGKLDRRALPRARPEGEAEARTPPRTPTEELLSGIWLEVLELPDDEDAPRAFVGVEENFFELGGHSLLATQVVARARRTFGVEVPLRVVFEAPTLGALAERIDALRRGGTGAAAAPPIVPVPRDGRLPLSFAQQRLWFIDRLEPGTPTYNMLYTLRVRGTLRVAALRRAFTALTARHEVLRTRFPSVAGQPAQVVDPPAPFPVPLVDLTGLPPDARTAEAERIAAAESVRPFDLARGPLLRATVVRLAPDEHGFFFVMHHVASDGWSLKIVVEELSALYAEHAGGPPAALPPLPVQYADYAVWQRGWMAGEVMEGQLAYWREQLAGAPPLLEVPTDVPRGAGLSERSASAAFMLSPAEAQALRALSRREGATLYMTVLAAWQALLARYAGQADVVVGTPLAGRGRVEVERVIGLFVNMLPMRTGLSDDPPFVELLARVREVTLGAYAHQEVPFERLVEELAVERSLAHSPVFQVAFALEHTRAAGLLQLEGAALEPFGRGSANLPYDLDLTVLDDGTALGGILAYRTALFAPATAERMTAHLARLLRAVAADPSLRLSALPLLDPAERAMLLDAWSGAGTAPPAPALLHAGVAAQAARSPGAAAVAAPGGETLDYAALDARANRLAAHLRHLGVGPEARVGIVLDRTPELVVAVLAVLRAGGAYVPMDPAYPAERLRWTAEDAGLAVVVAQARLRGAFPAALPTLAPDDPGDAARIAAEPAAALGVAVDPEGAAYVIYTSGSTGRPKGVVVPHRAAAGYVEHIGRRFGLRAGDRVLQFASPVFDASVEEIFTTLGAGAALVLRDDAMLATPDAFMEALEERRVTVAGLPTSYWHDVAAAVAAGTALPRTLRLMVVGGEAALPGRVDAWARHAGARVPLLNIYGPTETTIGATVSDLTRRDGPPGAPVPIGRPVQGARAYVLDAGRNPVPVGVPGELYVGGSPVARGYLGRPAATADRFVPDPFGPAGARLYRTGDRVRWQAGGELEYLGRADDQVKVRGYRIEPGEIAAVLCGHPGVSDAVVLALPDGAGGRRLAAWAAAGPPAPGRPDAAALRAHLQDRLPAFMVPAAILVVDALPRTRAGKVDRHTLPSPEWGASGEPVVGPRTNTEAQVCAIWEEVLEWNGERGPVGVHQNFFELGGHSLLATQVVARVREAFGVELQVRTVFEAPTVAELAARVEQAVLAGVEEWEVRQALAELDRLSDDAVAGLLNEDEA